MKKKKTEETLRLALEFLDEKGMYGRFLAYVREQGYEADELDLGEEND